MGDVTHELLAYPGTYDALKTAFTRQSGVASHKEPDSSTQSAPPSQSIHSLCCYLAWSRNWGTCGYHFKEQRVEAVLVRGLSRPQTN